MRTPVESRDAVSRRVMLRVAAATAGTAAIAGGWTPIGRLSAAEAKVKAPKKLPKKVKPFLQQFENWAGSVVTDQLWTVEVRSEQQVVDLANWAKDAGFTLRPKGFSHGWSPLAVADQTRDERVLMVDTRVGLTHISTNDPGTVTVGAGASLDAMLGYLDLREQGLAAHPAPGALTIGGMLAIGAHGTGLPADGESTPTGYTTGSLSNLVTSLRAVVWDGQADRYVARTFERDERDIGALLVNLSRAFVTEATFRVGPKQSMRCQSLTDVPAEELLAPAGSGGRTVAQYLHSSGRIEVIWFPFTRFPWVKVWSVAPLPPAGSVPVLGPYNYAFADGIFGSVLPTPEQIYRNPGQTPSYSQGQADGVQIGLAGSATADIWGASSSVQRYVRPSTLKVTANGYAILCKRSDVQWVINTFTATYTDLLHRYAARGQYPVNGPMEIRVMGVDDPADCGVPGAQDPWLSPTRRRPDRPDLNTVVYLDLLTLPLTPNQTPFYAEYERFLFATFDTDRTAIRVEWSKGWAYGNAGAYTNIQRKTVTIPRSLSAGQPSGTRYSDAVEVFNRLDPHRIYTSPLLDDLLPAERAGLGEQS